MCVCGQFRPVQSEREEGSTHIGWFPNSFRPTPPPRPTMSDPSRLLPALAAVYVKLAAARDIGTAEFADAAEAVLPLFDKLGERRSGFFFFFFFFSFFFPRAAGWRAAFLFFARLRRAIPPRPALPLLAGRYINRRDPGGVPTRITAPLPARVRKRMGGKAGPLSLSLSASLSLFSVPPFQALSSPSPGSSWRQR